MNFLPNRSASFPTGPGRCDVNCRISGAYSWPAPFTMPSPAPETPRQPLLSRVLGWLWFVGVMMVVVVAAWKVVAG